MLNLQNIVAAVANCHDGDTLAFAPGEVVLTSDINLKRNNVTLVLDGCTIRRQLRPAAGGKSNARIKSMNALGFSGRFDALSRADQAAVDHALPADYSDVTALVNQFLATLGVWRDGRMFGAPLQRTGNITYNGKPYQFNVAWGSGQSKGILNIYAGVYGASIFGGIWQNGRQEGSSYNGSAVRSQGYDHWIERATFQDCEDGILSGGSSLTVDPVGEWFVQIMPPAPANGHATKYGFHVDVDCTFDNNGAGGQAHNLYNAQAMHNVSVRPRVIRTNGGNALKYHGGATNIVLGAIVLDANDTGGVLQSLDFDSGYCLVVNSSTVKNTAGTGNYSAPILMRNDRDPQPAWFENRIVIKGSKIGYGLLNSGANVAFVRALNALTYYGDGTGGGVWPGIPKAITGDISGNVFLCQPGAPVSTHPLIVPPGVTSSNNKIMDIHSGAIPDPSIPLPNYTWTRAQLVANVIDLLHKADPGRPWEAKLFGLPLYPAGTVPAPPPPPPPYDEDTDPVLIAENQRLTAENQQLTAENAQLTTDLNAAQAAQKAAEDKITAAQPLVAQAVTALA